jgi:hypothetical protein
MADDDEQGFEYDYAQSSFGDEVQSYTLIVRLRSGVELEYDLDARRWPPPQRL